MYLVITYMIDICQYLGMCIVCTHLRHLLSHLSQLTSTSTIDDVVYCGFTVRAVSDVRAKTIIPGLVGVIAEVPEGIANNYRLNYSVFENDNGTCHSMMATAAFLNSDCDNNCEYVTSRDRPGIVRIRSTRFIRAGTEITVFTGSITLDQTASIANVPIKVFTTEGDNSTLRTTMATSSGRPERRKPQKWLLLSMTAMEKTTTDSGT